MRSMLAGLVGLFLLPGAAEGFSSGSALSQADVDTWMTSTWEAARQNASAWHGSEAWMPSAEQTGHAEQDAWLRVANAAADKAMSTSTMVSAWLKMTWRTVNTPNQKGVTALMAVASHGQTELLIQLLNRYARTDAQSRDGMTALMLASANGHAECAGLLLLSGANTSQADARGRTALAHALLRQHTRLARTLANWDARRLHSVLLPKSAGPHPAPPSGGRAPSSATAAAGADAATADGRRGRPAKERGGWGDGWGLGLGKRLLALAAALSLAPAVPADAPALPLAAAVVDVVAVLLGLLRSPSIPRPGPLPHP